MSWVFFLGLMVHVYCFDIKTKTDNYITVPKISQKKDIFNELYGLGSRVYNTNGSEIR